MVEVKVRWEAFATSRCTVPTTATASIYYCMLLLRTPPKARKVIVASAQ